jgi:hypothetical protein
LFQVVYCVITELCFILSHLLIHHKWKCLYQMLVNIMILVCPLNNAASY